MLASNSLSSPERALLAKVDSTVSYEEGMYKGDGEHYFKAGLSAIRCKSNISALVESYRQIGQGYLEYPEVPGYGVSLTSPEWIRDQTRLARQLREVYFKARDWDPQ